MDTVSELEDDLYTSSNLRYPEPTHTVRSKLRCNPVLFYVLSTGLHPGHTE